MKPVIIIAIAFVLLFIPVNVFAVDFVDSSGYIPEWVDELDKSQIIKECRKIAGTNPNEEKWCDDYFKSILETDIWVLTDQELGDPFHHAIELPQVESIPKSMPESKGGGCLIATATFGSELAPQVQQLREIRDNSLLQTESGRSFMEPFNQFYYSFSPTIADLERESPLFKEAVKLTITPLLSSLSLLNYVDMNSESEVLGYGISLILLNVGMYFVLPAIVIHRVRSLFNPENS